MREREIRNLAAAGLLLISTQLEKTSKSLASECPPGANGPLTTIIGGTGSQNLPVGTEVSIIQFGDNNQDLVQTERCESYVVPADSLANGHKEAALPQDGWWGGFENPIYNNPILNGCKYSSLEITSMTYHDYKTGLDYIPTGYPQTVISWLTNKYGQNVWLGYEDEVQAGQQHAGFAIDIDVQTISELSFSILKNNVNGSEIPNDETAIQFLQSQSTRRLFVLAYVSTKINYARANGENNGSHLCGANQIPSFTPTELLMSGLLTQANS